MDCLIQKLDCKNFFVSTKISERVKILKKFEPYQKKHYIFLTKNKESPGIRVKINLQVGRVVFEKSQKVFKERSINQNFYFSQNYSFSCKEFRDCIEIQTFIYFD